MVRMLRIASLALAATALTPVVAHAQDEAQAEPGNDAIAAEIAAMRAQMAAMAARIDSLESQLADANARVEAADATSQTALATAEATAADAVKVSWKGGPKFEGDGGWSFKPRGRLNYDAGFVSAPEGAGDDGFGSEARRARLGVEGDIPGGFGYKFEVELAGGAEVTDAIITYEAGNVELAVGQQNNFQSLAELTSSRFSSFIERAAFTDAFGFERRVGISGEVGFGDLLVQAGIFSDNIEDLSNKSWSADGRVVFMPKLGSAQLHLGGSLHYADLNDSTDTVRYRQRPLVHFTGERFINTGSFSAASETGYGLEGAFISGPFHAAAEGYWQSVSRPGFDDPTFFGGYAEVGYYLTGGDSRGYKGGKFDRTKPTRGIDDGGPGAWQVNLRYDRLDLTDAGLTGGTQDGYGVSLIWTPTDYTRLLLNWMRLDYSDATAAIDGDRSYSVDAVAARAQIDF